MFVTIHRNNTLVTEITVAGEAENTATQVAKTYKEVVKELNKFESTKEEE